MHNRKANGTSAGCPTTGNDKFCQGDKYEACLLQAACGGVSCPAAAQMQLATFLQCFEGQHASDPSTAEPCASRAGFDVAAVRTCASSDAKSQAAFAKVQSAAKKGMEGAKCFPWIVVNDEVESRDPTEGCFGKDAATAPLLRILCKAIHESNRTAPAGCPS